MQEARSDESRARLGIAVHRHDGVTSIASRACVELTVNRVFALGVRSPATRELVDTIISEYRDDGIARFLVQVGAVSRPGELRDWLQERGFVRRGALAKLARSTADAESLGDPRNTDVDVEEIGAEDCAEFEAIVGAPLQVPAPMRTELTATLGRPGWRFYLARREGRAIAGAALFTGDEVAWCGLAATLEAERGRGAQTALFVRRIRDAADAGCAWVTAETLPERPERPNPSLRNMSAPRLRSALRARDTRLRMR